MGFFDDLSQRLFGGVQQQQQDRIPEFQQKQLDSLFQLASTQQGQQQSGFNQLPGLGSQLGQTSQNIGLQAFGQGQQAGQGLAPFTGEGNLGPQIGGSFNAINFLLNKQLGGAGGIDSQANVLGGFGGGRNQVERGAAIGTAGAAFGQQVGDIFQQDLLRRQSAAGTQGQLNLSGLLGGGQLGLQGALQGFGLEQGGLLGSFGGLQQLGGILGSPTVLGSGTLNDKGGAFPGGVGDIAGLFKSDMRLKRDIEQVGETGAGQPVYLFRYLWSDNWYVGVMAQESPSEAVYTHESGFLMVDYGQIH